MPVDSNNENVSLRSAVQAAANEQNIPKEENDENNEGRSAANPDPNNSKEVGDEVADKETEEAEKFTADPEIEEALNFYRALRDPSQQKSIITELAQRAGLLNQGQAPTRAEEKKYGDIINEVLGEEYPDLKDKLGNILKVFEAENDKKLSYLRAELEQEKQVKAAQEFEQEFSNFITDNKLTEADAAKMLKEIEVLPPSVGRNGKRISLTSYLTKIHRLVADEKASVNKEVERAKKIERNLKERSTNLSSDISEDRVKKGSALPSIKEAVRAASEGVTFDQS